MKNPVIAALALCLFATPVLAEDAAHKGPHDGKGRGDHFFKQVDGDQDGKISRSEFQAKGDKMFEEADTNRDGFISREEGKAAHEARRAKWQERKAQYMEHKNATAPAEAK